MGETMNKFPTEVQAHAVRMDPGHGRGRVPPPDLRRELVLVVLPMLTFLNPKIHPARHRPFFGGPIPAAARNRQ
jgi:hypothetical protein